MLKSKAIFKPCFKKENLSILDNDNSEKNPNITKKERLAIKTLRDMPRRKTTKGKQKQPTIKIESSQ
jgi:hypothetical protein